ncbi:uncharacterized protein E0L32_005153 [Thyridium curvatum]|uniref:Uncharacterized protein n=1 Tax=Thyridium curvatum TaxID=1093900 RepID=A0A507BDD1_9PEZI|nr:uncharacterized protein E0L32_005153 [Thyridium curvatum]TPX14758.1 hypothetical protein E0L32_005153 [Thyridium curvatum]
MIVVRITVTNRHSSLSGKKYADLEIDYSKMNNAEELAGKHKSHLSSRDTGYTTIQSPKSILIVRLPITEFEMRKHGEDVSYYLVTHESGARVIQAIGLPGVKETDSPPKGHPKERGIWIPREFHSDKWYKEMGQGTQSTPKRKQEPPRAREKNRHEERPKDARKIKGAKK